MSQILNTQRQKSKLKLLEFNEDQKYLSGFKTAQNLSEFKHTTGNMGQLFSKTQCEIDRLQSENLKNAEVWKSHTLMSKAKSKVFEEQGMLVQTDKIAKLIESRQTSLKKNASNETMPTHDGDTQSITQSQQHSSNFVDRKSNTAVPGKRNHLNAILSADKESVWSKV